MSLRDGAAKMSKSDPSDTVAHQPAGRRRRHRRRRSARPRTDPEPLPETLEELGARPEADNLVGIFAALGRARPRPRCWREFAGKGFRRFKPGPGRAGRRDSWPR